MREGRRVWTMNALERNGYSLTNHAELVVEVVNQQGRIIWTVSGAEFINLNSLLHYLNSNSKV